MKYYFSLFLLNLLFTSSVSAIDYFPTSHWKTKGLKEAGFDISQFQKFLDYVWSEDGSHKTDSLVVIKDGYLVYEGYKRGYNENKKHMYWSLSKSLTSIIIGAAIQDGHLNLNDQASKYYPALNSKRGKKITLRTILNMSSGFDFYEEHPIHDLFSDSVSINYSRFTFFDVAESVSRLKLKYEPNTQFKYGTHEPILAMGILKKAINDDEVYKNYPWKAVFNKMGMSHMTFERDLSGTFIGGAFAWGTAKDFAKIGLLLLNDGVWENERILPEGYVDFATKEIAPALLRKDIKEFTQQRLNIESYGAYFWLNKKLPMNKKWERPYPAAPSDMIQSMGFRGQTMAVFPSENIILVRLGSDGRVKSKKINRNKMHGLLLASLKELKTKEKLNHNFKKESSLNKLKSISEKIEKKKKESKSILEIYYDSLMNEAVEVL